MLTTKIFFAACFYLYTKNFLLQRKRKPPPKKRKKTISYEFLPTANGSERLAAQPPVNHSLILKPLDFFDISIYSNSTITNQFCLEIILCRVYSSFDYLIYPYYPAYTG